LYRGWKQDGDHHRVLACSPFQQ